MDNFVNLHGHSFFSLLDGMTRPKELVDYTLKLGQPASCITDHGVMYSIVDHFQYAENKGQRAIAGFEAYVVQNHKIKDKASEASSETDNKREHMVILAKNNEGYKRMTKLCSAGLTEGFYYRPRIDDDLIRDFGTKGLIGMSACLAGRIAQNILKDRIEEAEKWAIHYFKMFNEDFYLEIQPTIEAAQVKVNLGLIEIHKRTGIPMVATTDFHYLKKEDSITHDVLLAVQSRSLLSDPNRWKFPGNTFYVMSREEILQAFNQNGHEVLDQRVIEEAVNNTTEIAERCSVSFNWGKHYLPQINPPADNLEFNGWASDRKTDGSTSADYLRYLCIKGLKAKKKTSKDYRDRLDYELGVINQMGFPDYFLIMQDIMRYCREEEIPVGPARGSGGGSLVAYACGITKIDPLIHDLLFERFLNPERAKLPDIDSDFCIKKGPKVFQYLINKYGKEYCCNIATFGRLQLKLVIKDIAKALGVPFEEVNEVTKNIPEKDANGNEIKHVEDLEEIPELRPFFQKYPDILVHARKLEGSPRHVSQHPAGVCVTPIPITDLLPVQNAKETEEGVEPGYLSQFEKDQTEQCGAVKLDILKLKNVTEIDEQIRLINELYPDIVNEKFGGKLTEEKIPFDDEKSWALLSRGDTMGIFQMASNVAIPVLRRVKPKNIEELSAVTSFIRPGASGLEEFLAARNNPEKLRKLDERLDRHLFKTSGAIVYQEQIMQLISELMGISFGQADLYRRALEKPKKNPEAFQRFKNEAVSLGTARGFTKEVCETVRDLIIENSGYGFNKSHAVAYSYITYWTAWIKANFPLVFYTAMFNGNLDKLSDFMEEAKKNGITIRPPHVCYSKFDSTIEDEEGKVIRIGLNAVKGVGPTAVESIVATQPYASVSDFFERNNSRAINKKVVEALIKANAFEGIGIEIEPGDMPEATSQKYEIKDGKVFLNRNQMSFWYEQVNEAKDAKPLPNFAIPESIIKGKYLNDPEITKIIDKDRTLVIPGARLVDFGFRIEDVEQYKTRKKPKGCLIDKEEDALKKIPVFRKPFIFSGEAISNIKVNYLETYLQEVEEFGFSFLSHPLENKMSSISIFSDAQDGQMLTIAGIVTELTERLTKNKKKYYWVVIQTPREKVRVTLWDNQYKPNASVIVKNKLLMVRGIKGYGGISFDLLKELKFNS